MIFYLFRCTSRAPFSHTPVSFTFHQDARNEVTRTTKKELHWRFKDVAHLLDVSPDDVVDLARKGKLRAIKVGRFWRFRFADVVAYQRKAKRRG